MLKSQKMPPCASCGYNLRTLHPQKNCPECGYSILQSLQQGQLDNAPLAYIQRLKANLSRFLLILISLPTLTHLFMSLHFTSAPRNWALYEYKIAKKTFYVQLLIFSLYYFAFAIFRLTKSHPHRPYCPKLLQATYISTLACISLISIQYCMAYWHWLRF